MGGGVMEAGIVLVVMVLGVKVVGVVEIDVSFDQEQLALTLSCRFNFWGGLANVV